MLAGKTTALLALLAAFAMTPANAHTVFTTLSINGVDQGDGTCVRMPSNPAEATFPIRDLASPDMICGQNGLSAVKFTCPVPARNADKSKSTSTGAALTFAFREYPDNPQLGRGIDPSHKGPCAVYMKQLPESAPSDGWFKIFEEGYDEAAGKWCTEKLIDTNGLLTVSLPAGLPGGSAYLVRPELLALHRAQVGDPQFYIGCAQIYLEPTDAEKEQAARLKQRSVLVIPAAYKATIPGYVKAGDPSVSFDLYNSNNMPPASYAVPGPGVFEPSLSHVRRERIAAPALSSSISPGLAAGVELVPSTCLVKNANWCGVEVPSYSTEAGCWDASADCYRQEKACYDSAPPSGHAMCTVWDEKKCSVIQAACQAGIFNGPPHPGQALESA